jgi:coenzyme F420 hydrogenase subunit beta
MGLGIGKIVSRVLRKRWSPAAVHAYVGDARASYYSYACDDSVRAEAASGGVVSTLLLDMLVTGAADGALICRSVIEDGRVRARYAIATTREEVLSARGSVYVVGDFAGEAMPLIRAFQGRIAVVALPCEVALLRKAAAADPMLAEKLLCVIGLVCGHASEPQLIDTITDRLTREASAPLSAFRFRMGHWRGFMRATFENGAVIEKPFSAFGLYQNLYAHCAKKCLFCGDHFAYEADISVGDVWDYQLKNDPIKRSGVIVRTDVGAAALAGAREREALVLQSVPVARIIDGQSRVAPFHYNVSARSEAGRPLGVTIPDRVAERVTWHERLVARMTIANQLATAGKPDSAFMRRSRRLLKAQLYLMKGLESLPTNHGERSALGTHRFALIAGTFTGNHGAETMLTTTIGRLRDRYPDAVFEVYTYHPQADALVVTDPAVRVRSSTPASLVLVLAPGALLLGALSAVGLRGLRRIFPRPVRALAECDALIDMAGVSFVDGREKFLPFNLLTIWSGIWLRVPVVKLSQAMGPFKHPANRLAARSLRHCALVFARGDRTWENLNELGLGRGVARRAADVGFLHRDTDSLTTEGIDGVDSLLRAIDARAEKRPVVGVCPSSVVAGRAEKEGWDYVGFLGKVVDGLLADGCDVLLFPNATRAHSSSLRNNDLPVIAAVVGQRASGGSGGRVFAVDFDVETTGIKHLMGRCEVVMVSRFHAMVGALTLSLPVFVLGWGHKYLEVMEQFGLGGYVFDSKDHDPAEVLGMLGKLRSDRTGVESAIAANLETVCASSLSQFEAIYELIDADPRR